MNVTLKNSLLVKPSSFKCIFVCFGTFFMRGKKLMPNIAGPVYLFKV